MQTIAFFTHRYLPWSETFQYEIIRNLRRYRPVVMCRTTENLDRFPLENIEALSNLPLPAYLCNSLTLKFLKESQHFEHVVRKYNVQLLNACFGDRAPYLLRLKKKCNIPLVTFFYGDDATRIPKQRPGIYDELFRTGDLFIACAQSIVNDLVSLSCPRNKIKVLYTGIDLTKFTFKVRKIRRRDPVRLLYAGRLVEKKGCEDLLKAIAMVQKERPDTLLTIVGDGPLRSRLTSLCRELHLRGVRFLHNVDSSAVAGLMHGHHIFVSPVCEDSVGGRDIIPNTLVEASATGMPVVSSNLAGNDEAVIAGKTGILVRQHDAAGLADALITLTSSPRRWHQMGAAGRKHVERHFDIRKQVRALEHVYSTLIASSNLRAQH